MRISVKNSANEAVKIRLYAAENFGGPVGLFRMKIGREWLRTHEKYVFFSAAAALEFAARSSGLDVCDCPRPAIDRNDRVRVTVQDADGNELREKCFVASPPFQGADGRWRVFVLTFQSGMVEFLCDDVEAV